MNKLFYAITKNFIKKPISVIVFVTDRCNSRCGHCFNWKNITQAQEDLSLDIIKKFSKSLGKLADVSFSGGEPFLRDDLDEIVRIFVQNNSPCGFSLPTNGLLPEKTSKVTKEILKQNPVQLFNLNLALDGDEKLHDEIRGVRGNFEKVSQTYEKLVDLKKGCRNLSIKIDTTISNKNIKEIGNLISLVKRSFREADFHNFEILRGSPRDSGYAAPCLNELEAVKKEIYQAWRGYSYYGKGARVKSLLANNLKEYIFEQYLKILKEQRQIFPCLAGSLYCVLWNNGDVAFCELLDAIGNIKRDDFYDIWRSKKAGILRESIKRRSCYCVHSCFQCKNVLLNFRLYPEMISFILKKWKR